MKTGAFGYIAGLIVVCTLAVCFALFDQGQRERELELGLSRCILSVLKTGYEKESGLDKEAAKELLLLQLEACCKKGNCLFVEIKTYDMEKGILSVLVTEQYTSMMGNQKELRYEKTAIVE